MVSTVGTIFVWVGRRESSPLIFRGLRARREGVWARSKRSTTFLLVRGGLREVEG